MNHRSASTGIASSRSTLGSVCDSSCGAWSGEGCCTDGGEGVRCTARFFDRADGLKKPHFGHTYSVQTLVNKRGIVIMNQKD